MSTSPKLASDLAEEGERDFAATEKHKANLGLAGDVFTRSHSGWEHNKLD